MDDGFEAIVKIPYHISVPRYYATASEADTLQYLRGKRVPVPEVYGYSASGRNAVGVEYIIMEKAAGVGMSQRERLTLASKLVEIERKVFDLPFGVSGNVYFKGDVPAGLRAKLSAEEKSETDELYRRRLIFYYYRIFNCHLNKPHIQALRDPLLRLRQHLVDRAGRQ